MDKRICVITGSSGGIGGAIFDILAPQYDKVYLIGRSFPAPPAKLGQNGADPGGDRAADPEGCTGAGSEASCGKCETVKVFCDLRNHADVERAAAAVSEPAVDLLVNCAGAAYYGVSDTIRPDSIREMVDVNLTAPMVLTSALLPKIRRAEGTVVFVSSVLARKEASTHAAVYGATKKAISFYAASLFEELRKHNVRVVTICPDVTDTGLYRNADFAVGGEPDNTLAPSEVAEALEFALDRRPGMCVNEIVLRPQRNLIKKKKAADAAKEQV